MRDFIYREKESGVKNSQDTLVSLIDGMQESDVW